MNFELNYSFHTPVLKEKLIQNIITDRSGVYLDGTTGGAGHSKEILSILKPPGRLVCVDKDEDALKFAENILKNFDNKILIKENFVNLESISNTAKTKKFKGIILDLGMSTYQINTVKRGFSFMEVSPLDMRMDKDSGITAAFILNTYSEKELADIFYFYGEEKKSRKIARKISEKRILHKFSQSDDLVEIIRKVSQKDKWIKTAARIFQALRIAVNNELEILKRFLEIFPDFLLEKGRIGVISYHSLEDRLVKDYFKKYSGICICPKEIPVCRCKPLKKIEIITKKPIIPDSIEIKRNPASRSAKLRIAEKV